MEITSLTITVASLATLLGIFSTIVNLIRNRDRDKLEARREEESVTKERAEINTRLKIVCEQLNDISAYNKANSEWKERTNIQIAEIQNCIKTQADELREFKEEMKYQRDKLDEVYAEMQYIKTNRRTRKKEENEQ